MTLGDFQLTDPTASFGATDGGVPALTQAPPPSSSAAPSASSPLATLQADLSSLVDTFKAGNQAKQTAGDALSQLEQLVGIGPEPVKPPDQTGSVMTMLAVLGLLVLGAVVVWKVTRGGA